MFQPSIQRTDAKSPTLLCLNSTAKTQPWPSWSQPFNAILDRFTVEERLLEIKQQRPGVVANLICAV
jgi:hypothetical protein